MARYVGHAVDQYGRDIPGAYVTVVGMDGLPATLTDDFGNAISQPLRTDDYGGYYFNTSDGLYTITTTRSGETIAKEYNVVIGILPTTDGFQIALAAEASERVAGDALVASNAATALAGEVTRATAAEQAEVTRATGVEAGLDTRLTTAEGEIDDLQTVSNLGGSIPYNTYADAVADFTPYASGTTYTVGKRALDQGAVWINILAGTGVAPPTLPTTSNANWQLVKNPTAGQAIVIPITDTGSHTDPTTGTTVTNTGIHVWATGTSGTGFHYLYPTDAALAKPYADAAAASATAAANSAATFVSQNVWPDPFMEEIAIRPMGDRRTTLTYGPATGLSIADANSPWSKNALLGAGSSAAQYYRTMRETNTKVGDTVTARIIAQFTGANGSPQLFFRDSSGNTIGSGVPFTIIGGGSIGIGTYDMATAPTTVPANFSYYEIRVAGGTADKRLLAAALGVSSNIPAYVSAPPTQANRNNVITQKNLWPDHAFRQWGAGVLYQDGYGFFQMAGQAFPPSIVSATNPIYQTGKVLRLPVGFTSGDMCIDPRRLGLRAGDQLTIALQVNSTESLKLLAFPRDASGAVIGSLPTQDTFSFPASSEPLYYKIPITQAMVSNAAVFVVRISTGSGVGLTGTADIVARGIFANNTQPLLYDDCFADDMAAIERHRRSSFGLDRLRETHNRIFRMKMMATTSLSVTNAIVGVAIGDSYYDNVDRETGPLTDFMQLHANNGSGYGSAGIGFLSMAIDGSGTINGNGWRGMSVTKTGSWSSSYYGGYGPDIGVTTAAGTGSGYQYSFGTYPANLPGLHFLCEPVAGASYRYSTDGGSTWTTVDASTGTNINNVALTIPSTAFTLLVQPVTGTPKFYGPADVPAANGFMLHKLGSTGSATTNWAPIVTDPRWQASLAALNPTVVFLQLGKNDQANGSSPVAIPTYSNALTTIVAAIQTAAPMADIWILSQPEDERVSATLTPAAALASVARNIALLAGTAWSDTQQVNGLQPLDYRNIADGGTAPTRQLWEPNPPGIHPYPIAPYYGGYPTVRHMAAGLEYAL